jgi:hypothetical protein
MKLLILGLLIVTGCNASTGGNGSGQSSSRYETTPSFQLLKNTVPASKVTDTAYLANAGITLANIQIDFSEVQKDCEHFLNLGAKESESELENINYCKFLLTKGDL